jgi:hypothetical protein
MTVPLLTLMVVIAVFGTEVGGLMDAGAGAMRDRSPLLICRG